MSHIDGIQSIPLTKLTVVCGGKTAPAPAVAATGDEKSPRGSTARCSWVGTQIPKERDFLLQRVIFAGRTPDSDLQNKAMTDALLHSQNLDKLTTEQLAACGTTK